MKKKSLIMLLSALMIVTSVAFGTIAYLTDRAGVTNKFTIGNVDIVVDETEVDEEGKPVPDPEYDPENPDPEHPDPNKRTEEENEYPLLPGTSYVKDPTLTVKAGSEESYVRMMVTITSAAELKQVFDELKIMYPEKFANGFVPNEHVEGWDSSVWPCYAMTENAEENTIVLEFRYPAAVPANDEADTKLPALFTKINVPGELTGAQLQTIGGLTVDVKGHAIQTAGFENEDAAWAAFDAQMKAEENLSGGEGETGTEGETQTPEDTTGEGETQTPEDETTGD